MKQVLFGVMLFLLFSTTVKAETYCQNVNRTGQVVNAAPMAQTARNYLRKKGIDYKSSPQEITNTMKNYCQKNPYASADQAADNLVNILQVAAELMK